MREIDVSKVRDTVRELCLKANFELRKDILSAVRSAVKRETNERARSILRSIIENARIARLKRMAICQDTGMVFVNLEVGQAVIFTGGGLYREINEGVREAYQKGCLRKSVVGDPILRKNTGTNTPAVIFTDIVEGSDVAIEVSPKGFGSENKSAISMFRPTAHTDEIKAFVIDVVKRAGPDACPPLVLGVAIGGTFETSTLAAKKALLRPVGSRNPKKHIHALERDLLKEINALGIGPMGLGGKTTVLGVNIVDLPTHIAGLPVAVSVSCHATRSARRVI